MTQLTPISGFVNTPISKSICILSTILPISLSILVWQHYVTLAIDPFIIEYSQFWRIFTYQFAVINESDFLLTALLWFQFKVLERFYGSRKYLSIIVLFAVYNALACFLFMSVGQLVWYYITYFVKSTILHYDLSDIHYTQTILNEVIPGPLGILSSLYVSYGSYIPLMYHFKILLTEPKTDDQGQEIEESGSSKELNLTNKFPVHVLYTILILNNGFKSIVPCTVGLIIGRLHTYDLLPGGKSWLIPNVLFQLVAHPVRKIKNWISGVQSRFSRTRYQPLSTANVQVQEVDGLQDNEEPEESDEVLDEERQRENH
ncbi:putative membrane protein [Spathaspora sp. JA1]|nr:putative membrane protein [Spathaspora sp. JA1]